MISPTHASRILRRTTATISLAALPFACAAVAACARSAPATTSDTTVSDTIAAATASGRSTGGTAARDGTSGVTSDSVHIPTLADTLDPGATVRAYLAAARAHHASRDTLVWGPAGDSANGFRGFIDTTIAAFAVGAPGRVEGAAGSRYVTLPVSVDIDRGGARSTLRGTATLRRAVVDGATRAQRTWRIVRIEWNAAP